MQGRKGHFPEADKDPVIQIANVLSVQGQSEPVVQNVFTLKGCLPIVGAQVIINDTEEDLLIRWRSFVQVRETIIAMLAYANDHGVALTRVLALSCRGLVCEGRRPTLTSSRATTSPTSTSRICSSGRTRW